MPSTPAAREGRLLVLGGGVPTVQAVSGDRRERLLHVLCVNDYCINHRFFAAAMTTTFQGVYEA